MPSGVHPRARRSTVAQQDLRGLSALLQIAANARQTPDAATAAEATPTPESRRRFHSMPLINAEACMRAPRELDGQRAHCGRSATSFVASINRHPPRPRKGKPTCRKAHAWNSRARNASNRASSLHAAREQHAQHDRPPWARHSTRFSPVYEAAPESKRDTRSSRRRRQQKFAYSACRGIAHLRESQGPLQ